MELSSTTVAGYKNGFGSDGLSSLADIRSSQIHAEME
jgi:hypothetical protein